MSQNLYIHCYNNPIGYKDPSGFSPSCGGHSSFRGSNDTDNFGPGINPNPIPDGAGDEPKLTDEQQELWDWCKENGIEFKSKSQFLQIWSQAGDVAEKMQKYKESGGVDLNKYDFEIAFWSCYWNDKAKLGLEGADLVGFANEMKAITYFESTCGANPKAENEGLMGMQDHGNLVRSKGWVNKNFNVQMNTNDNKGIKAGIQASLYMGIAHYLLTVAGYNYGDQSYDNWMTKSQATRSSFFTSDKYAIWACAYGGPNDFVKIYYGVMKLDRTKTGKELPKDWAVGNPYGNAVHDLATKGEFVDQSHNKVRLLP